VQQPGAPDLRDSQSRFLTRQGAKADQLAHEVLGDVRALGDLSDPVRHQDAASHPRLIVAQPGCRNRTPGSRSRKQPRLAQMATGRCCPSQEAAIPIGAVLAGVVG
jgi:hypothetical protein